MGCQHIYKDANGKPSAIYQRALEKYGPDKAEEIYVTHMISTFDAKFSKATTSKGIDARSEKLELTPDEKYYVDTVTGKLHDRVTSALDNITSERPIERSFGEAVLKKKTTVIDSLDIAKENLAKKLLIGRLSAEEQASPNIETIIADKIKAEPDIMVKAKKDITSLWEAQRVAGDDFHAIISKVITKWDTEAQKRFDAKEAPITIQKDLSKIIAEVKEEMGDTWRYNNHDRIDEHSIYIAAVPVLQFVADEEKRINHLAPTGAKYQRISIKSERKVYTDRLKVPNSAEDGIAGSIDLLFTTANKSYNKTGDFKTKALHKAQDFDKTTGRMIQGPSHPGLVDTAHNRAIIQQSLYGAILSMSEYNHAVDEAITFLVPLNFVTENYNPDLGEATYKVSSIAKPDKPFRDNITTEIQNAITWLTKGDLKTVYDEARSKGISGMTERWSGSNEDGVPNATWSKDHKESAVKKALLGKHMDTKGKQVVTIWFESIPVTGMTDEEIVKALNKVYEAKKQDQNNIANDIRTLFYHPNDPIPKTLINRSKAVAALLQGFSMETHDLFLAQMFSEELRGIGPDVLIARNQITGALSFLSAITTTKNKVSFRSDGSKKPRTSLLGNYKTDAEIESGSLVEDLMSEPTTHDYISMKLGLAAMHIRKNSGNTIDIDQMKVVSLGYQNSVFVTTTTFEQEIAKLKMFEKYAGTDFPASYAELLKDVDNVEYIGSTAKHLENLMAQIANNTDPLGHAFGQAQKKELYNKYQEYNEGKLVGFELKKLLGNYVQSVATKLQYSVGDSERILSDPRFVAASKAFLEFMNFQNDLGKLAAERNSVAAINGAVSSGDAIQIRLHVIYNEASARIRNDMDSYFKEHTKLLNALMKSKGVDLVNLSLENFNKKVYGNMYKDSTNPEDRMTLKDENDSSLSKIEKEYIKYWNDKTIEGLLRTSPKKYHAGILDGSLWKRGTVPTIYGHKDFLTTDNFKSWTKLKKAVGLKIKSARKETSNNTKSFLEFGFATQFDGQATDESHGNSELRRSMLGISDMNAPKPQKENIETNLGLILNLLHLEGSEKLNYDYLLQSVVAAQSVLASIGDRERTNMSKDMINIWKEMVIFNRYKDEKVFQTVVDPLNTLSSQLLFTYSIRQAMIELSTGTLQTAASLISNTVLNAFASFIGKPENAGRYTMSDFTWGVNAWDAAFNITADSGRIQKIVWDAGMLVADADNIRSAEFEGKSKGKAFTSEAGFALNRLFFNSAITHTFLAQVKHLGIDKAYIKKGDNWVYDETLDSRFYVWDPETKMGTKAPETDDEKIKHSIWVATRKVMDKEGQLDGEGRMRMPLTANDRAEIKHYATRTYGSFNKDADVAGEAWVLGRSMLRYKKWATQKIANWYTPTVTNDMWGHWEQTADGKGGYVSSWVGDDFQGILQTLGFITKEIASLRGISAVRNLNRYQRENLSKLLADLTLTLMMMLMVLPFIQDNTPAIDAITGESTNIQGDFGKSKFGTSAFKAAANATSDLFFVTSILGTPGQKGPAGQGILSSILPGLGTIGRSAGQAWQAIGEGLKPEGEPGKKWNQLWESYGIGRSIEMVREPFTK